MAKKTELFAGLNTVGGYVPLLEHVLAPMKKVYVIKGSSGCGKSTMMKRIAGAAEAQGREVVRIFCSSDPDSLDGVIIPSLGVGVADGTPPHTLEPTRYGIREITVSLENSFDYGRLDFFSSRLGRLFEKKAMYTRTAAACISACGELEKVLTEYTSTALNGEKTADFCASFVKRHTKRGTGKTVISPTDTFCRKGFVSTETYCDASSVYVIRDRYDVSSAILHRLYAESVAAAVDMAVIPCPTNNKKIVGIYYPSTDVLIKSDRFTRTEGKRNINVSRFIDGETLALYSGRLGVLEKLRSRLYAEAAAIMDEAFGVHGEIEKIYSQCVDFEVTDSMTKTLIERILS